MLNDYLAALDAAGHADVRLMFSGATRNRSSEMLCGFSSDGVNFITKNYTFTVRNSTDVAVAMRLSVALRGTTRSLSRLVVCDRSPDGTRYTSRTVIVPPRSTRSLLLLCVYESTPRAPKPPLFSVGVALGTEEQLASGDCGCEYREYECKVGQARSCQQSSSRPSMRLAVLVFQWTMPQVAEPMPQVAESMPQVAETMPQVAEPIPQAIEPMPPGADTTCWWPTAMVLGKRSRDEQADGDDEMHPAKRSFFLPAPELHLFHLEQGELHLDHLENAIEQGELCFDHRENAIEQDDPDDNDYPDWLRAVWADSPH